MVGGFYSDGDIKSCSDSVLGLQTAAKKKLSGDTVHDGVCAALSDTQMLCSRLLGLSDRLFGPMPLASGAKEAAIDRPILDDLKSRAESARVSIQEAHDIVARIEREFGI